MKRQKPWTNKKGEALSDKELKKVSKDWSLRDWEKYLLGFEKPMHRNEVPCDPQVLDGGLSDLIEKHEDRGLHTKTFSRNELEEELLKKSTESISSKEKEKSAQEELEQIEKERFIHRALDKLSLKQKKVIHMIFWEDLTERQVGGRLGIGQSAVHSIKKRAFKFLEKELKPLIDSK